MNPISIIILIIIIIFTISVIIYLLTHKKKGCGSCNNDCETCEKYYKEILKNKNK